MNKAFVIRDKEGKYYSRNLLNPDNFLFENRIVACELFATKEIAKFEITFNELKDCEVVEITIAEGDLSEKLNRLEEYIKNYTDDNGRPEICNEYMEATCRDILEQIKVLRMEIL